MYQFYSVIKMLNDIITLTKYLSSDFCYDGYIIQYDYNTKELNTVRMSVNRYDNLISI